ncbi:DUF559 domain-containing protein [Methylopila sp. M107]|uniref:endonuclease domain-containing protein n=1 Tax=Methylopila sp. M107 TaxID=1101190 RepID=UPI00058AE78E|nr:DUF559 domain-containing protein [Methylopila sp. M107]
MSNEIPHHCGVRPAARENAKRMRREPTLAEAKLWRLLRDRRLAEVKFRRQAPFGRYILDFVCFSPRIVVEADGGQHDQSDRDKERDAFLGAEGFTVIRYWNNEILGNPEGVLEDLTGRIAAVIEERAGS